MDSENFKVIVTGFGPFKGHNVNASWETAKALNESNLNEHNINLIVKEIPVIYDTVINQIPSLWKEHQPDLMVHLGVSSLATELTLETLAHKSGYKKPDVQGNFPASNCCYGNEDCIYPELDVKAVSQKINKMIDTGVKSCVSTNAGRYLCEFTFYASLCINRSRVVFIHVPEINKPYSIEQMAKCVKNIILLLVEQIKTFPKNSCEGEKMVAAS